MARTIKRRKRTSPVTARSAREARHRRLQRALLRALAIAVEGTDELLM
jgi:hypothetical protein